MARIDFDSRNLGKKIHDDGEYEIPPELHAGVGQDLSLPQRFGINKSENPPIIFDRFPGWSDSEVTEELDRIWKEDVWPTRVGTFMQEIGMIKQEAAYRLDGAYWLYERALERAKGDHTDADVVAEQEKRDDCRAKSGAREVELKEALMARTHPEDWPATDRWNCALGAFASNPDISELTAPGKSKTQILKDAKDQYGIEDPGSGL